MDLDFSIATSDQIEKTLYKQLETIRLARNFTQSQLAAEAGVSLNTIKRMESGAGISFNTFIRLMLALDLGANLQSLLPNPTIRPIERVNSRGVERRRARPKQQEGGTPPWQWGDEKRENR